MKNSFKIGLVLALFGLALCANVNIRESASSSKCQVINAYDGVQMEIRDYQIANGGSAIFYIDNCAGMNQLDFYMKSSTSGNITAATCQPIMSDGLTVGSTQTLTSGTDLTDFRSLYYKMTISNPVATTINITANILITK